MVIRKRSKDKPAPISRQRKKKDKPAKSWRPGQFTFGNQLWSIRKNPGRPANYPTPESLWEAALEYFQWVEDNPLIEQKIVSDKGSPVKEELKKMRPYTIGGLCVFINISAVSWYSYKSRDEFVTTCSHIEQIIREQKFDGAAAGFFKESIISRDLGLANKTELTGADGTPLIPPAQSDERAKQTRIAMLAQLGDENET